MFQRFLRWRLCLRSEHHFKVGHTACLYVAEQEGIGVNILDLETYFSPWAKAHNRSLALMQLDAATPIANLKLTVLVLAVNDVAAYDALRIYRRMLIREPEFTSDLRSQILEQIDTFSDALLKTLRANGYQIFAEDEP